MKKHLITLLVISVFTTASAQSYTQAFDSVFRHVDLSHTSTGILSERDLPPEDLPTNCSWVNNKVVSKTDTADTQYYKHSVGVCAGIWFDGLSLKFNILREIHLQVDFGLGIDIHKSIIPEGCDIGLKVNMLFEDKFPNRSNTYWIAGGGVVGGIVPHDAGKREVSLKSGVQAILGIEYFFNAIPMSIQTDTRLGYGNIYSADGVNPGNRIGLISSNNPYHYFDYGFVFSVRYHFGKKN